MTFSTLVVVPVTEEPDYYEKAAPELAPEIEIPTVIEEPEIEIPVVVVPVTQAPVKAEPELVPEVEIPTVIEEPEIIVDVPVTQAPVLLEKAEKEPAPIFEITISNDCGGNCNVTPESEDTGDSSDSSSEGNSGFGNEGRVTFLNKYIYFKYCTVC